MRVYQKSQKAELIFPALLEFTLGALIFARNLNGTIFNWLAFILCSENNKNKLAQ
jgi:hypothetical protein